MSVRPISNAAFYTVSPSRCRAWVEDLSRSAPVVKELPALSAGIVPHAGWMYSGAVAAQVWKNLRDKTKADVIVIFGAVHYPGVHGNSVYPEGAWETPLGNLAVDRHLADRLLEKLESLLTGDEAAHKDEHSIEVQMPFVKVLFPECRVLPVAVPPSPSAVELGEKIAEMTRSLSCIAVGSTDLTHYGPRYHFVPQGTGPEAYQWMLENDRRMLDRMLSLEAEAVQPEARDRSNACGPGAIAATLAFARKRGAKKGTLLRHTTSHEVRPEGEFEMGVGYAGVVF